MDNCFKMVAKTLKGLEAVLADELRALGAINVEPGHRMVSFEGDLEMLYRANLCCRTALRILKPIYTFSAADPDALYERLKEYDWASLMTPKSTFAVDTVVNSDVFTHSRYATYRVKDAIADWFRDRYDERPSVRLTDADVILNVHINNTDVTVSLDSSGESLHKRGWRVAQTEAPINEVLAAGIILLSGYRGDTTFVDPMCGSGTFLIEAALIAANINPGVFRREYAFKRWTDFDADLFDRLWNDDSAEHEPSHPIIGADILKQAIEITNRNLRAAGVASYVTTEVKPLSRWDEAPAHEGLLVMNPPYGERISAPDMDALYELIGERLKHVFTGWNAWIIGFREEYFQRIGLAPSEKIAMLNGSLDCELRQYIIFSGNKRDFRAAGGRLKEDRQEKHHNKLREGKRGSNKDRFDRENNKNKRFGDRPDRNKDRFDKKTLPRTDELGQTPESDNPLALRRNPQALKSITNRQPTLPKTEGPIMRPRGWRKKS